MRDLTFCLLIIQRSDDALEKDVELPEFLPNYIVREVTDESLYSPGSISQQDWYMPQDDFNKVMPELVVSRLTPSVS